jgi:2-dehydropantoate 2-reductase
VTKVCIVGAGAIGGLIGARLALAGGAHVSALARGETLAALRANGLRIAEGGADAPWRSAPVQAADDAAALGPQDLVVVAVKGPAMAELAPRIAPLLQPDTVLLPAVNGVPWWFANGLTALGTRPLESVDPGGALSRLLPPGQVLGCVVHLHAARPAPGCVAGVRGRQLIVGEPSGADTPRLQRVATLLREAGFDVTATPGIRRELWYKLWGNLTINPVSALTGATADRILADPLVRGFCSAMMEEAATIGRRIGCTIEQTVEDRHAITAGLGAFRTSMLQDVQAERPIELDAIVAAVAEIGARVGVSTPNIDALLGLTRLFARVRGLYPEAAAAATDKA